MYLKDFIYDNDKLSDLGCIIGSLNSTENEGLQIVNTTFDTVINNGTFINELISAKHDSVVTLSFDIFKNPCINGHNLFFTDNELSYITKWLAKKEYHKFIPIYDDFSYYSTYFIGSFTNITSIKEQGNVVGLSLSFQANAPFGFTHVQPIRATSGSGTNVCVIIDSDEIGVLYPEKVKITLKATPDNDDAKFVFYNDSEDNHRTTEILHCSQNEILTFDCIHKILQSSDSNHKTLYKDFNYVFPRLFTTIKSGKNLFVGNVAFDIEINYAPIKKVGAV